MEYRNKDENHIEWAKALKELYIPGLRDYVKGHYPLGPVWSATGKTVAPAPVKAPTPGAPAPPRPPPASLFSSETAQPSSSRPKDGMAAVFAEISSGKPVTSGNYHSFQSPYLCLLDLLSSLLFPSFEFSTRSEEGHC